MPKISFISENITINGTVRFSNELRLSGTIDGELISTNENSKLVVERGGSLTGKAAASNMLIRGTVCGEVSSNSTIELMPTAKFQGDLYTKAMQIHSGAVIQGNIFCGCEETD